MDTSVSAKRKRLASLMSREKQAIADKPQTTQSTQPAAQLPTLVGDKANQNEPFLLTNIQQSYLVGRSGDYVLGNISTHNYFEINIAQLDIVRFGQALNRLIAYHGMLRAVFFEDGRQQILPQVPTYEVKFVDLLQNYNKTETQRDEAQAKLLAIRQAMSHQIYQVDQWPLFEVQVARSIDGNYRAHFSLDMLIADAMSTMILIKDLDFFYDNPQQSLPVLDVTFKDYVHACEQINAGDLYSNAKAYWQQRVSSIPAAPDLPLATSPETIENPRFKRRQFILPTSQWQALQARIKTQGISPSVFLMTVFSYILAKWSKSSHFTLNLTLLNRVALHEQINVLVGDFTALSMLEVNLDPKASFLTNSKNIQRQLWRDIENRYFDGIDVLRLLNKNHGVQQSVSMPIVFTSALGLAGSDDESFGPLFSTLNQLSEDSGFGSSQSSQVWLDHVVRESEGALGVSWDCLEALFPEGLLDDMFDAYGRLLSDLVDDNLDLSNSLDIAIPPVQLSRREQVNNTSTAPSGTLLHQLFFNQVAKQGDKTAIKYSDGELDYAQLAAISLALALKIHNTGLQQPRPLIAIVMHKGWEQVAATLGVLASGAAYVPIDANLPIERVGLLLDEADVTFVITQPWLAESLTGFDKIKLLLVDSDLETQGRHLTLADLPPLAAATQITDMAYMIYTSGSTGVPKGVVIDHRGAVNTIVDINQRFAVNADDTVLALSSLSFDLSVYDIFGLLAAGGTIYLPDADRDKDPAHWVDILAKENITLWNSVPALAQLLVDELDTFPTTVTATLRLALLSGDWIPLSLPAQLTEQFADMSVISLGGATEASIWSIFYPVDEVTNGMSSIPYGKPLSNQTFHVLDQNLGDKPEWVAGELYIGGLGVALEYRDSPEKNASHFIIHPKTGQRLYRTGDNGRYLPDGNIEFLGRDDNQIKIRGNRVELGEIESTLNRHPMVQDSIVMAIGEKHKKRLVCYVLPGTTEPNETAVPLENLTNHIRKQLPAYMVPSAFMKIDKFPLTANGKVDRRALPVFDLSELTERRYVPPESPVEIALCAIWEKLLEIKLVGIDDNFFEIGGDSLLVTRAITQIRSKFGSNDGVITIANFFESPTVRKIAGKLLLNEDAALLAHNKEQISLSDNLIEEGEI